MNGTEQNNYAEAGNTGAYGTGGGAAGSADASQGGYANVPPAGAVPPAADPYAAYSAGAYGPGYGYVPQPPPVPGSPNPGLAALLGFIPGVGAMYNGQFAKGLAHIVIFAILQSLASHAHEPMDIIFGLLTAGWFFYMVFDAYQTARARRDGLVPPDPFGLNNIGEKFGVTGNPSWGDFVARPAGGTASAPAGVPAPGMPGDPVAAAYAPVDPAASANPNAAGAYPGPYAGGYGVPYAGAYGVPDQPPYAAAPGAYAAAGTVPPPPYSSPYAAAYVPGDPSQGVPPVAPPLRSGIPTGAIWLIGLGALALVGSLRHSYYWSGRFFITFVLLAVGAVLLVQRTLNARALYPVGTPASMWAQLSAARPGITVLFTGVLQGLNDFGIASWSRTWPYLLILLGVYQLAGRMLYNRMVAEVPTPSYTGSPYAAPVVAGASTTAAPVEGEVR